MAKARRSDETVRVQGLDKFRSELRKIQQSGGADGIALLKEANYRVASMVVGKAQSRASSIGPMQAKAAASLRPGRLCVHQLMLRVPLAVVIPQCA